MEILSHILSISIQRILTIFHMSNQKLILGINMSMVISILSFRSTEDQRIILHTIIITIDLIINPLLQHVRSDIEAINSPLDHCTGIHNFLCNIIQLILITITDTLRQSNGKLIKLFHSNHHAHLRILGINSMNDFILAWKLNDLSVVKSDSDFHIILL